MAVVRIMLVRFSSLPAIHEILVEESSNISGLPTITSLKQTPEVCIQLSLSFKVQQI